MRVTALVGCQWGDEGKGKVVDILSEGARVVARFQGGANAGHTVVIGDTKHVLHLLPVGILREGTVCILGNGMVIDPDALAEELALIAAAGMSHEGRLFVSPGAHVILPMHTAVEAFRESSWSKPIGTTLRGIGPAYETKMIRIGLRVGDLLRPGVTRVRVTAIRDWALATGCPAETIPSVDEVCAALELHRERLAPMVRAPELVVAAEANDAELLLEGAQGVLLDVDHGTYPFVTSSATSAGNAMLGTGLPARDLSRVIGVCKAYTTRVGEGPFPTEFDEGPEADAFRDRAGEFGATTGRPRRCGWLDGVLMRQAMRINGVSALVITKLDVLDGTESIPIAVDYELPPGARDTGDLMGWLDAAKPVYETVPGWSGSTAGVTSWDDLPAGARAYIERIEAIAGVPVAMVSTGTRRDQIIVRRPDLLPGVSAR